MIFTRMLQALILIEFVSELWNNLKTHLLKTFKILYKRLLKALFPGADPGFCVRGDESWRGVWGPLSKNKYP
jgi:hypothetical protein